MIECNKEEYIDTKEKPKGALQKGYQNIEDI
jgi:hypothetical protein